MERFWVVTDERDSSLSFVAFSEVTRIIPVMDKETDIYCYIQTREGKREQVRRQNEHELPCIINEDEIIYFLQNREFVSDSERLYRENTDSSLENDVPEEYIRPENEEEPLTAEDIEELVGENIFADTDDPYDAELDEEVRSFLEE